MSEPIGYRWNLTGLQFKVLCDDLRLGGLPRPFTFTSNTRFADDYERERNEVRAALREVTDPRFDDMVRALTRPDIMVLANLWNERHHTDPQQCLRVHAVRRDDRGYVITQRPGETVAHSGGFDIAECSPAVLARTVVGLLPEAGAGRDPQSVSTGLAAGGANPDFRGFPASGTSCVSSGPDAGVLKVIQGRLGFRVRGIIHVGLVWRDLPGDGRYVMGPEAELVGMDGTAICDWIEARMAEIMVRLAT
ncbi:ESX secretion-associated protein EspG [Nocardia sp. NPDC050799]|uniref:ESX secretion-associated protein EspG n=1 Tax=Nocardia sp. NPDC050799 TaxID=3154842 RepID=UPI0033C411AC